MAKCWSYCRIVNSDSAVEFQPSPFFSEQLTAFELWLEHGSNDKKPPEQLPIVLQVHFWKQEIQKNFKSYIFSGRSTLTTRLPHCRSC